MQAASRVSLLLSIGVFLVFLSNVILGAFGGTTFMSIVAEMLTLFLASILFVVAILARERLRDHADGQVAEHDQ